MLDDYEEGEFTAFIADTGLDNTATHTTSAGFYTRIGNHINVCGTIRLSNKTGLTSGDQASIAGMPYTSENTASKRGGLYISAGQAFSITANASVTGNIQINTTYFQMGEWNTTNGVSTLLISEIDTGTDMHFHGDYYI